MRNLKKPGAKTYRLTHYFVQTFKISSKAVEALTLVMHGHDFNLISRALEGYFNDGPPLIYIHYVTRGVVGAYSLNNGARPTIRNEPTSEEKESGDDVLHSLIFYGFLITWG